MSTFSNTYGSQPTMAGVAGLIDTIELIDDAIDVHTVTLTLSGQHGEFDVVIEGTDNTELTRRRWTAIAFRSGGVMDLQEVK
jgi:hypothetical protein